VSGHVLVAEDQSILREFIAKGLTESGFLVRQAVSNADALDLVRTYDFDVWVLDRNMADGDSIATLVELRKEGRATPALFLTAAVAVEQRVHGLEAGADDYLSKPFSIDELVARIRALLRRPAAAQSAVIQIGLLELNLRARRLDVSGQPVDVTANEFKLLAQMARAPGKVFERRQIMDAVGMSEDAGDAAVDHLVSRLRGKLRAHGADGMIRTVRGMGYVLAAANDEPAPRK
jgi:DNA-binding response OmpR family regulator